MKSSLRLLTFGLTGLFIFLSHAAFSQSSGCGNIGSGSISFNPGSCSILPEAKIKLSHLAEEMRGAPQCRVIIVSNSGGNKPGQQLSWERVQSVIEEMSESSNIDRNRFIFIYDGVAPGDNVVFQSTSPDDDRPSSVPPPYPGGRSCK